MQRRLLTIALMSMVFSSSVEADDSGDGPTFDKVIPTDAVRFVTSISDDGKVSTMIFDNFDVTTDVGRPTEPDSRLRSFTYVRRIKSTKDSCVIQDIRGFVSRSGNASVSMIVHSGGRTTVVDLKEAIAAANKGVGYRDATVKRKAEQAAAHVGFTDNDPPGEDDDDFYVRISTPVPKGQSLQTTILLLVDRIIGDDDSQALLVIDSIDSEIKQKPEKKK